MDQHGPGLSVTHAGQFTSARVCVGYSEIPSGLRQRAARRLCEKPRKATKCVPGGAVRRDRPHAAHFQTPAGMGGFDGRRFLNVSD